MTISKDKAQEVANGVIINDNNSGNTIEGPFYTGGPSEPLGLNLPVNTVWIQNKSDGILTWRKFGIGVNDWSIQESNLRREDVNHDYYIPSDTTTIVASRSFNEETFIDGELFVL